jgi:hypothetical protein
MDKLTVKFETFEKIYKILKAKDTQEVSFEFLIASCFPHVLDNIKEEMRRQYTEGYVNGLKEGGKQDA